MKQYFKFKTFIITLSMITAAALLSAVIVHYGFDYRRTVNIAQADATNNLSGWAWSPALGWVSFNCSNRQLCSTTEQFCAQDSDCPGGETCSRDTCSTAAYGVNVDPGTGNFSGNAWSSNLGWIDFSSAQITDFMSGQIGGWAKILARGDDGWLNMNSGSANVKINLASGIFSGLAWNNNSDNNGIGWLSFNCRDMGTCSQGPKAGQGCLSDGDCPDAVCADTCGISDYKVSGEINRAPTAENLLAPSWTYQNACDQGALLPSLKWTFSDPDFSSSQSAYQIIFDTANHDQAELDGLADAGTGLPLNTGEISGSATSFIPSDGSTHRAVALSYNQPYYWWVKIWDNWGKTSGWTQYNTASDTDNDDGNPLTFTTYKHGFPQLAFDVFPSKPSKEEEVKLFDNVSQVYLSDNPMNSVPCDDDKCDWLWTLSPDTNIIEGSVSSPTFIVTFLTAGTKIISLKVTDQDNYYCVLDKTIKVTSKLPSWEEIKPK